MGNSNKLLLTAVTTALVLTTTACGGSKSSSSSSSSGIAVDGYLIGSTVTCDGTGATTLTDDDGEFTFRPACNSTITVTGGTNKDTGYAFLGSLQAPKGSSVVTPLTNLVVAMQAANPTLTVANVVEILGLPAGTDVLKVDPVAESKKTGDAGAAGLELLKKTLAVQQLVNELSEGFSDTNNADAYNNTVTKLAASITAASTGTKLFDSTGKVTSTVLSSAATALNNELPSPLNSTDLDALTNAVSAQTESLISAADVDAIQTIVVDVQNPENVQSVSPQLTNYLYFQDDSFSINGMAFTYDAFTGTGAELTSDLETIAFDFEVAGSPSITDRKVDLAMKIAEVAGQNRQLEVILSGITVDLDNGELSIEVPAAAMTYAYGQTATGKTINVALKNASADIVEVTGGNVVTLNYEEIIDRIANHADAATVKDDIESLKSLASGIFDVTVAASNINLRKFDATALAYQTISVTNAKTASNTSVAPVSGVGVKGKLTIQ